MVRFFHRIFMALIVTLCAALSGVAAEAQPLQEWVAVPRSEAFPTWALDPRAQPQAASEPAIAAGSGWGWHQVLFTVTGEREDRLQHAIVVDYTPATAVLEAELQERDNDVRTPDGWETLWGPYDIRGYGIGGRLYWCYSFAQEVLWGSRAYRLLFRGLDLSAGMVADISFRFGTIPTESSSCERTGENDGGIPGVGTSNSGFGPFDITVDAVAGEQALIYIGIRDHACEDGDIVSVYLGDGYGDRVIFSNTEIFNGWQEKPVSVRAGYYYQVRAVAVNAYGGRSGCQINDVNTGAMRVTLAGGVGGSSSTWSAEAGDEHAGIVNVLAGR